MSRFTVMVDGAYYAKNADGTIISGDLIDVLGAYEDITNAPNGTERLTLSELRELVDAKVDGRCVVLPCKAGDVVWEVTKGLSLYKSGLIPYVLERIATEQNVFNWARRGDFGKIVFLNREEADAALDVRHAES